MAKPFPILARAIDEPSIVAHEADCLTGLSLPCLSCIRILITDCYAMAAHDMVAPRSSAIHFSPLPTYHDHHVRWAPIKGITGSLRRPNRSNKKCAFEGLGPHHDGSSLLALFPCIVSSTIWLAAYFHATVRLFFFLGTMTYSSLGESQKDIPKPCAFWAIVPRPFYCTALTWQYLLAGATRRPEK